MIFGNNIKRIINSFNVSAKMYKFIRGIKSIPGTVSDTSKCKDVPLLIQQLNSFSFAKYQTEKHYFNFPKINGTLNKSITEPDSIIKISFELPVRKSKSTALDLPSQTVKEINEPGKITSKSAVSHIIRIRKKKMKKHKRQKYRKKNWAELKKLKIRKHQEKEALFDKSLKEVMQEMETFSAEKYVDEMLKESHWEKPITKIKGFLAPKWVIDQHLKEEEYKRIMEERIKECQK